MKKNERLLKIRKSSEILDIIEKKMQENTDKVFCENVTDYYSKELLDLDWSNTDHFDVNIDEFAGEI